MQLIDGQPVYSATDLVGYLACESLTALERALLDGLAPKPFRFDRALEIVQKRGVEHEQKYLETLRAEGKSIVAVREVDPDLDRGEELQRQAMETRVAMAQGADVIYQATFFDGTWVGHADFLLRLDDPNRPSRFGPFHYEVADTKLARHVKASALLQICSYVDELEGVQGVRPTWMHVVLGGNPRRTETFRVDDYFAYYRMVRGRFEAAVGPAADPPRYPLTRAPEPVEHCDVCRWKESCDDRRHQDDHLSLVAGISRGQRRELTGRGVETLADLARLALPLDPPPERTSPSALERVREQARIQADGRAVGKVLHELLRPIEADKGLASLPPPSPGDLFLDLEGDPYALDNGLDYLFGVLEPSITTAAGEPLFHSFWSTDGSGTFTPDGEKAAFEKTVDLIMGRLQADPTLHVYHYAPYEPTAFKRLMGRYGTREAEVDSFLRGGVFVDLYRAVRQGLRASVESYSIKKIEPLYGLERKVSLRDATSSIVEFETWLQLGEGDRPGADNLENIRRYNRDDVLSTWRLRDWLEACRAQLVAGGHEVPRPTPAEAAPPEALAENLRLVDAATERLFQDVPIDPVDRTPEQQARWLLAQLLSWHRREEKSTWWRYFHLMNELTDDERIGEKEPIGGLEFVEVVGPVRKSMVYRYRFPAQEHAVGLKSDVRDPRTGKSPGRVEAIDEAARTIDLARGKARSEAFEHPTSLVPLDLVPTKEQRDSLLRLGSWVAEHGIEGEGPYRAARDLLLRTPPRLTGRGALEAAQGLRPHGHPLPEGEGVLAGSLSEGEGARDPSEEGVVVDLRGPDEPMPDAGCRLALALVDAVLPIQGPPGSGKTYTGAHMVVALLAAGRKVGLTANSHKVIGNLLAKVCEVADEQGVDVRPIQKADGEQVCDDPHVVSTDSNDAVQDALASGEANLAAGTSWLWARQQMEGTVDVLFVDEAGQMSLANAVAVAPAGRSLVLLGDPQQLDQPQQGVHPPGAEASALGHLLGEHATMPPDRGLFLEKTWRLHPDVCRFTSEAFYDAKLTSMPDLARQRLNASSLDGAGLWLLPVSHVGNDNCSQDEASVVAQVARRLVEGSATWVDRFSVERKIGWEDVLIVAPYNAQVAAIQALLPVEARVGTVDKFQGQQAPVSIYSMATSSAEEAPRGMNFLYSRHRLNVATSRAQCVAIVICSPDLLRVQARTPEQMRLANALCQFVEQAGRLA